MASQIIYTRDHPRANQRTPKEGEEGYEVMLIGESNDPITLRLGAEGYRDLKRRLRWWRVRVLRYWTREKDINGKNLPVKKPTIEKLWGETDKELDRRLQVFGDNLRADMTNSNSGEIYRQNDAKQAQLIATCHEQAHDRMPLGTIYEIRYRHYDEWIYVGWRATWEMQHEPLEQPAIYLADADVYRLGRFKVGGAR